MSEISRYYADCGVLQTPKPVNKREDINEKSFYKHIHTYYPISNRV